MGFILFATPPCQTIKNPLTKKDERAEVLLIWHNPHIALLVAATSVHGAYKVGDTETQNAT